MASPPPLALGPNLVPAMPQPYVVQSAEPPNRRVKRDLWSIHIFLIVMSGTIGMGLFKNSGEILAIAGPGGGITAFTMVGFSVMMVMEGLAEMITHWPISNAMIEFVRVFIDKDLAIVIGIAYVYAYSISFTTLIIVASDLASHWNWSNTIQNILFIFITPLVLLVLNCFGVSYYGNVEALCGILKIMLVTAAFLAMCVINHLEIQPWESRTKYIDENFQNNEAVASNAAIATLVAFPIATYAYLDVEIVAVTAVEARTPHTSLRVGAKNIAWITSLMYITSVVSYYFNVEWTDPKLPSYLGRIKTLANAQPPSQQANDTGSSSIIIIAALNANEIVLSNVLNGLLIMAVLSAANTALYVSSRTLWGLACNLDPQLIESRFWYWRWLSKLSTTTPGAKVPGWALLVSGLTFWFLLPILRLAKTTTSVNIEEIMSGVATVGVVVVWASQCLAFIRYRSMLYEYRADLIGDYAQFAHHIHHDESRRFESHLGWTQPGPAWIGLIFSIIMVALFATASWWNGGASPIDIVSNFAGPGVLFILWLFLKLWRYLRGDDFEWVVTVNSWNQLRSMLDGLTNAIHRQDYNSLAQPPIDLQIMQPNLQAPSQTPLVGQEAAARTPHRTPTPEWRDALGTSTGLGRDVGESSGYGGPAYPYPASRPGEQLPRRRSVPESSTRRS